MNTACDVSTRRTILVRACFFSGIFSRVALHNSSKIKNEKICSRAMDASRRDVFVGGLGSSIGRRGGGEIDFSRTRL